MTRAWGPTTKAVAVATLAASALLLPWAARNASLPGGRWSLSDGRSGMALWVGTWERNGDWARRGIPSPDFPPYAFRDAAEERVATAAWLRRDDRLLRDLALDRLRDQPVDVIRTWAMRYPQLWLGTRFELMDLRAPAGSIGWTLIKGGLYAINAFGLLLAIIGMALAVRARSAGIALLAIPPLYIAAIILPFHNIETRYSMPAVPFLYVFAAYALLRGADYWRSKRRPASA